MIAELRRLLSVIDAEVAAAYGWDDVDLTHDFREFGGDFANNKWRWALSLDATTTLLDRLVALNRERFEAAVNANGSGRASSRTHRRAMAEVPQPSLESDAIPANEGQYLKVAEPRADYRAGPVPAIVEYLSAYPGWHAKADVLAATGITDGQWNTAIAELLAAGRVERQGERRGARYRVPPSSGTDHHEKTS